MLHLFFVFPTNHHFNLSFNFWKVQHTNTHSMYTVTVQEVTTTHDVMRYQLHPNLGYITSSRRLISFLWHEMAIHVLICC